MALTPQAQETFTRLFGAPAAPHPTDPELYEILQNQIFDEVFSTGVLTDVEREIITVTALGCLQTLPQLRAHAAAALNVGATPLQLREALYQCAPYIGYPRTLNAVATLDEVLTQRGVELPLPTAATVAPDDAQARHRAGAAIQEPLYGDEIEEVLATLPAPFDAVAPELVTTACFGDYYSRGRAQRCRARDHQPCGDHRDRRHRAVRHPYRRRRARREQPRARHRRPRPGPALRRRAPGPAGPRHRRRLRRGRLPRGYR